MVHDVSGGATAIDEFDRLMSEGRSMREGEIGFLALAEKDHQRLQER